MRQRDGEQFRAIFLSADDLPDALQLVDEQMDTEVDPAVPNWPLDTPFGVIQLARPLSGGGRISPPFGVHVEPEDVIVERYRQALHRYGCLRSGFRRWRGQGELYHVVDIHWLCNRADGAAGLHRASLESGQVWTLGAENARARQGFPGTDVCSWTQPRMTMSGGTMGHTVQFTCGPVVAHLHMDADYRYGGAEDVVSRAAERIQQVVRQRSGWRRLFS